MIEIFSGLPIYLADRRIKETVSENMELGEEKEILGGNARLTLYHNYGSAGNLGAGNPRRAKVVSILLTTVVSGTLFTSVATGGGNLLNLALSLLAGGAFSNTYDRVKHGFVIDYLQFNRGPKWFKRLVWNIADFAIIIGSILTVFSKK